MLEFLKNLRKSSLKDGNDERENLDDLTPLQRTPVTTAMWVYSEKVSSINSPSKIITNFAIVTPKKHRLILNKLPFC